MSSRPEVRSAPPKVLEPVCWMFPVAEVVLRSCVFPEAAALSGRHRGLCIVALLGARAAGAWSQGALNAADLCEALR